MDTIVLILVALSLLIWIFLLVAWGNFWQCDQRIGSASSSPSSNSSSSNSSSSNSSSSNLEFPHVTVVIPARNEAEVIGTSVRSLLNQNYPGTLSVIVVDDQSDDGTTEIAQQAAEITSQNRKLSVLPGKPLAPNWTGKLWALEQGTIHAQLMNPLPTYLLLTDADIEHAADNIYTLVAKAEQEALDLVSLMVKLRCETIWEKLLIPAFVFFFQKLYPFAWVNDSRRKTAAAAGGCMLIRRTALERIGGIECVRDALIDDCALATAVKSASVHANRHKIWVGLSQTTCSLRPYTTLKSIWQMVARTAYTQLQYSPLLLLGTLIGMTIVYLTAPLGLMYGTIAQTWSIIVLSGLTWILMALAYWPTLNFYKQNPTWSLCLPLIAFLYTLMTLDSAIQHWQGKGGAWKGRVYSRSA